MNTEKYSKIAGKIIPEDIKDFAKDLNASLCKYLDERDALHEKYKSQSEFKKGDKVMALHRKQGWLKAKIKKLEINELTGDIDISVEVHGKIVPAGHLLSIRRR